jgi:hypothetical protein
MSTQRQRDVPNLEVNITPPPFNVNSNLAIEQVGIGRLKEAIETTDWETDTTIDIGDLGDTTNDVDGESPTELDIELTEMNRELLQMKTSLGNGNDEDEEDESNQERTVEDFTSIMSSLQAIRGTNPVLFKVCVVDPSRYGSNDAGTRKKGLRSPGC